MNTPILKINNLSVINSKTKDYLLKNISLTIGKKEILGLIGPSGSGKSTLAKALVGLIPLKTGSIFFNNELLCNELISCHKFFRKNIQMVFQDPTACLNPRMSIQSILLEPLQIHLNTLSSRVKLEKICEILSQVGLNSSFLKRYPHELSGGQKQRICIARSLILNPEFLIFDEAFSALDTGIQAQILNLLKELKREFQFTLLFISHDIQIVQYLADKIAVMQNGQIVELKDTGSIINHPTNDFTIQLMNLTKKYQI